MAESNPNTTALSHRTSPEDLDELMQLTTLHGWIALLGCALLLGAAFVWSLVGTVTDTVEAQGVLVREDGIVAVPAPCAGTVAILESRSGVPLDEGTPLFAVTPPAGKVHTVKSPFPCQILHRALREHDSVKEGESVLLLENLRKPLMARLYLPVNVGYGIETNMPVQVLPSSVNSAQYGFLQGRVVSAAKFPITQQELAERLQNKDLAQQLAQGGPKLQVLIELSSDAGTASGYHWSASAGPPQQLYSGTPCQGRIVVAEHRPIHLVFPSLGK